MLNQNENNNIENKLTNEPNINDENLDLMSKILLEEELMNNILTNQQEARILSGKEVAAAIADDCLTRAIHLQSRGCHPTLAVFRVGERPDDIYYENSIKRHCEQVGVRCQTLTLPATIREEEFASMLTQTSQDSSIHGIFFFSPLPPNLNETYLRSLITPDKDVDCLARATQAELYFGGPTRGFAPCTAAAVMEMLRYYQIPVAGKQVVVLGRSLVVGRPLAMLLLDANATVTIAHSKSENLSQVCWQADIVIAAVGKPRLVQGGWLRPGQVVIDIGANADPENGGKMCGDVDFAAAHSMVEAITPVPGGVGLVTTAILCRHVIEAAERESVNG